MKDIVEKILREEERASKILQDAKEESERIAREIKKNKENIITQAIVEAEALEAKQKEASLKSFMSEKEKILQEAKKETLAIREKKDKDISEISKKVFYQIIAIKD